MAPSQHMGGSIPVFQDKPVLGGQKLGHFYYRAENDDKKDQLFIEIEYIVHLKGSE